VGEAVEPEKVDEVTELVGDHEPAACAVQLCPVEDQEVPVAGVEACAGGLDVADRGGVGEDANGDHPADDVDDLPALGRKQVHGLQEVPAVRAREARARHEHLELSTAGTGRVRTRNERLVPILSV
jgi:hypothetical protein